MNRAGGGDVVETVVKSLGRGFDITADFRLKYCKDGDDGDDRLVVLDETQNRELHVPGFGALQNVSADINCDKGERTRFRSDILDFNKMSEYFNKRSSVTGKIPSGNFNATFGFQSGSWATDAANVKALGLDASIVTLFNLHIHNPNRLRLTDRVRNAVPSSWDPQLLARFIEKYGTHVITGVSVGGQDVVVVRQDTSSDLDTDLLRHHLYNLGDQLFTGSCLLSSHRPNKKANHNSQSQPKFPEAFNVFDDNQTAAFNNFSINSKDGITVICAKRGGDGQAKSHSEWLVTVPDKPDAINFNFIPITSLLKDVPGCGLLSHAMSLYLRYKAPLMDLQYFLEFSGPRTWAPIHNDLPFGAAPNMASAYPSLHINFLGPKLYVNTTSVTSEKNPVTGMRFFLEGKKCNRLAIHLQHLENMRTTVNEKITDDHIWRGSDEISDSDRYFEPLNGKKFSHVCTAPVKYDPNWITTTTTNKISNNVAYIVTGAQLEVKKHGSKSVLHLRLRFTGVSDHNVVKKEWVHGPGTSKKSGIFSTMSLPLTSGSVHHNMVDNKDKNQVVLDSGVFPGGPPVPANNKIVKFVDLSQLCRGPQHSPGHWLVTGARLYLEKGKLNLHVKFALLHPQRASLPLLEK
ncbi:MACPF domain-containing protein [Raphanus sativus]|uniref:MACPF domain-containing protein At1g14780 n=1 Tax=Raphanus sativus TaxID=3726 RepID=A0A6J0JIR6_RAPSA|nr:MACPF domain-containing protein At1g14780 [Raphanus sativus]KAJ4889974.1 MACPF domain-containing protein [Raphanus sativus]